LKKVYWKRENAVSLQNYNMTNLLSAFHDFLSGKLERDNDERCVGGVWDYCIERYDDLDKVEKAYNTIWGLFEYIKKEKENNNE
jgi:hypothetical protein